MKEKTVSPVSGYLMLFMVIGISLGLVGVNIDMEEEFMLGISIVYWILAVFCLPGFFFVNPNGSRVLVLFGTYKGTVKKNGFFWVNPFYRKIPISLRARNFDSEKIKVNDSIGNPILISVILVWRVKNTFKAAFEVDNYENFVRVQCDAAVRKMAAQYPYDNFDDEMAEITLRSGVEEINHALENEIDERLSIAGIDVMEARIGYLAYASEIAGAMLKRQQATAIVAARLKIVEGAVGMVEKALEELSAKQIIELDDDKKAAMVSNLMVVLCSDKDTSPVVNTGTLHT
ncbi:MAG: SPFH domain-containing protein [Bacteroidetes bacterium]|nr:SPFH domain-containing protein [Bacteroidota bacterium]